ncbi:uncharacterized protein [Dermacentor albipictus]|uniref:uncharacterized protein isoform X3 n=1 Tax=Dermacentor albipictus TaxID=60249 RepID=UPI0031FD4D85
MPHVFTCERVRSLLRSKRLVFLGCSNVRAIYKDLICLYHRNSLVPNDLLKQKMEESYDGDHLVNHGKKYNGRGYLEERIFCDPEVTIYFYFLTKIYSQYVETIMARMTDAPPDVVIVSSCLWDITRWGPRGVDDYKKNLHRFFWRLRCVLPQSCLVIWLTAAPLSQNMHGGFLLPELDFLKYSLRFHVNEANYFCKQTAAKYGIDVVDIHYYLRMMIEYRAEDGIHWHPVAVRLCTNLTLTHLVLSWGKQLPNSDSFLTISEKQYASINANDVSEEEGAECSYLYDELSQSKIFGSEVTPQECWYDDVFDYEEFAKTQETNEGGALTQCACNDTLGYGHIMEHGYEVNEEENGTSVFRDPLDSDTIDINDMIIVEEINESSTIAEHPYSGIYGGNEIEEEPTESVLCTQPDDIVCHDEEKVPCEDTLPTEGGIIAGSTEMVDTEFHRRNVKLASRYEPSKDTILPDRDVIGGDADIHQTEEPCEGTLPVENDDILDNTDAVDTEAARESGPPPESSFCGIFGSNEITLKKEPRKNTILPDRDVIVGDADILKTEDERSPPMEFSFRGTTSDEEPCGGTLPVENDDILDNSDAVDTEAASENGPPPESSFCGIFGSNEIILTKAVEQRKPNGRHRRHGHRNRKGSTSQRGLGQIGQVPEYRHCQRGLNSGDFCADASGPPQPSTSQSCLHEPFAIGSEYPTGRTERGGRAGRHPGMACVRPVRGARTQLRPPGLAAVRGHYADFWRCRRDRRWLRLADSVVAESPAAVTEAVPLRHLRGMLAHTAVKRRKPNRHCGWRRRPGNQGSTSQCGSCQLTRVPEYSHCQPGLKYGSGDFCEDASDPPLPSTSQDGFHQTCGPA